jgi:hypothetical protein
VTQVLGLFEVPLLFMVPRSVTVLGGLTVAILALNEVAALIAIPIFARQLAIRIPNLALARECRLLLWLLVGVLLVAVVGLVARFGPTGTPGPGSGTRESLPPSTMIICLLILIWWTNMIRRFQKGFRVARDQARSISALEGASQ